MGDKNRILAPRTILGSLRYGADWIVLGDTVIPYLVNQATEHFCPTR